MKSEPNDRRFNNEARKGNQMSGILISMASLKGGTRKSSHVIGLASGLIDLGHTVRIIDADEQGSSEQWLSRVQEVTPNLDGHFVDLDALSLDDAVTYVSDATEGVDFTLVDTKGAVCNSVNAALLASDLVLSPFKLTEFDVSGLFTTRSVLQDALESYGEDPSDANAIVALYVADVAFISNHNKDRLTALSEEFFVRRGFPDSPIFPQWVENGRTPAQMLDGIAAIPGAPPIKSHQIQRIAEQTKDLANKVKELIDA